MSDSDYNSGSVYSTSKIIYHSDLVQAFMKHDSHNLYPIFIQLMPNNSCNQKCTFCSYRFKGWKNNIDLIKKISWEKMQELVDNFMKIGVKAIELTGGGEPLHYPYIEDLLRLLAKTNIEVALVTNGSLLTNEIINLLYQTKFIWGRVSIDCGTMFTYKKIRKRNHWTLVWNNIKKLVQANRINGNKTTLGLGFVVNELNYREIFSFCKLANEARVDNVRISVAFTPKGRDILLPFQIDYVQKQINDAKKYFKIKIIDVFKERFKNLGEINKKDNYCGIKDILCVIEGEGNIYTCCSLTGNVKGLMGNINKKPFKDIWKDTSEWRKNFKTKEHCQVPCLYDKRNEVINSLRNPPEHLNFV